MTPMKAALLSVFTFFAIAFWAVGTYTADAEAGSFAVDGYGVAPQTEIVASE